MAKKGRTCARAQHARIDTPAINGDRLIDVTVVILEDGYASTAIAPIEIFHSAGVVWNWLHGEALQPRFRVRTASIHGRKVNAAGSLGLAPDCAISDIKKTDIIIIAAPGWDVLDQIAKNTPLVPWVKKWHERGAYIAGACTGVAFLAKCEILDGRVATTHWGVADIFRKRYPKVRWQTEQFVTEDSRLFSSGGVYASIDLSLYLVEKFCGHEVALLCAKSLLLSMPRGRQSGYSVVQAVEDRIPTTRSGKPRNTCSNTSIPIFRSIASPSAPAWARVISFAVSRPQLAAFLGPIFRHCGSRLPRKCWKMGHLRSRRSPRRLGTTTSASSGISQTPYRNDRGEYRDRFSQMSFDRGELASGRPAA